MQVTISPCFHTSLGLAVLPKSIPIATAAALGAVATTAIYWSHRMY